MKKGFWLTKGTEGDPAFDIAPRIEAKRPHRRFADDLEPDFFSKKRQAIQIPNGILSSEVLDESTTSWGSTSRFQPVQNQFIQQLFGSESVRTVKFSEQDLGSGVASLALSTPLAMVDTEVCVSRDGLEKVNQVKESANGMHGPKEHGSNLESNCDLSTGQTFNKEIESNFLDVGPSYDKDVDAFTLVDHAYTRGDTHGESSTATYIGGHENFISLGSKSSATSNKEDVNMISFVGYPDPDNVIAVGRPISSYEHTYDQSLTSEAAHEEQLDNANPVAFGNQKAKPKPESLPKTKADSKTSKKESPNSFPSNVRSLISTGMLDGVPIKYIAVSREELHGIIKGSGYLCGCKSCNYNKVLNAYEFERHAGSKTKHPNNHIYFENGKTIYQIVQELRSTPENMLFDVIQTCFGAPINQKAFRVWKESFQAATRELQRIYGKEELNL